MPRQHQPTTIRCERCGQQYQFTYTSDPDDERVEENYASWRQTCQTEVNGTCPCRNNTDNGD